MFERWDEVELDLKVETMLALDEGAVPAPLLVAFDERDQVAVVGLRPFDPEGVLQALVEVLALLLPLGTRRVALGLPGRVRDVEGPGGPEPGTAAPPEAGVAPPPDGGPILVVATGGLDGDAEVRLGARVLPLAHDGACWQWRDDEAIDIDAHAWDVTRALGALLDPDAGMVDRGVRDRAELQAQLARCLLLGHTVALSGEVADELEPDRLAAGARGPW